MPLLQYNGINIRNTCQKKFEEIQALPIITMENGRLRSYKMVMSQLGSAWNHSVCLLTISPILCQTIGNARLSDSRLAYLLHGAESLRS
jgi:hypothetical protein